MTTVNEILQIAKNLNVFIEKYYISLSEPIINRLQVVEMYLYRELQVKELFPDTNLSHSKHIANTLISNICSDYGITSSIDKLSTVKDKALSLLQLRELRAITVVQTDCIVPNKVRQIVFVDLDGVLADLDGTLAMLEGYTCPLAWYRNVQREHNHKVVDGDFYRKIIGKHLHVNKLFENLELMDDFQIMLDFLQGLANRDDVLIYICSSAMDNELSEHVKQQKYTWVSCNLVDEHGNAFVKDTIITKSQKAKVEAVRAKMAEHECVNIVMIDDAPITNKAFAEAGLSCILHTSARNTIVQYNKEYKL